MNFSYKSIGRLFPVILAVLILTVNCTAQGSGKGQADLEVRVLDIERSGGTVKVEAEIARTDDQRTRGLMFRKELEDGRGMLFVFDRDEVLSFWMKNTLIPLSIAFISYDGTILEIKDMHPGDLSPVHSSRSVRYALEVPRGWFDRAGVSAGDLLTGY